ncbi:MAG: YjjG family noncanonical pyrimidine nucleotidase [Clostridiales bacterium]|nr:YjjG family noncanonical pyrimidine nucleotidase [Clostridiales bacterium]
MKYEILLFDADNTILDFDKSEEQALRRAFCDMGLEFNQNVLAVYRKNNIFQWELFELGKLTKPQVLVDRFVETFKELNLPLDKVDSVGNLYEEYLKLGFFVVPHAVEVLEQLQANCKLYVVSNGVAEIQNSRMKGSGLEQYFIARFVSEDVGYPKPQIEYFDYCFKHIDGFDKSKTLIIGDSLTSDIQGGVNAGIDTCWFNPKRLKNTKKLTPCYEITDLRQLIEIVR